LTLTVCFVGCATLAHARRDRSLSDLFSESERISLDLSPNTDYTFRIVVTGQELNALRQKLALTQAALAEAIGVTSNTVARWERGEMTISEPVARLIEKIAEERRLATRGS
jgi:DNA-binding transcriptional regulator YiaG